MQEAAAGTPRLGVLGAGHVGPVIARLAIRAGYPVAIAGSGDPADLSLVTELLIPGARPMWAPDVVADADLVVLAIPMHRFLSVDPGQLAGKLVIDAMNYWPSTDGVLTQFENIATGSSEIVAARLPGAAVVKALNHIGYHELEANARPAGSPDRRAAGIAGDDGDAVLAVARFIDRIGYTPVRLGGLRAGRVLQPGGTVFGAVLTAPEFEQAISAAGPAREAFGGATAPYSGADAVLPSALGA
jgi:8-hydroxy-5-deazaflavin:NADPH oxidoreductase